MFIFISWKNKEGKDLRTMIDHTKVDSFVSAFIEQGVTPEIIIPELDSNFIKPQQVVTT